MGSMAGAPRVRSLNIAAPEEDARLVLVTGGNKAKPGPAIARKKPSSKPLRKATEATPEKPAVAAAAKEEEVTKKNAASASASAAAAAAAAGGSVGKDSPPLPSPRRTPPRKQHDDVLEHLNLSLNASCSSEASMEPLRGGRTSGGRMERSWSRPVAPKHEKAAVRVVKKYAIATDAEVVATATPEAVQGKRRCAWVTPTTDPCYVTFHDEEWGIPVHDDRRLFELLVLSGALAELTWPEILKRRHIFREIFINFDPVAVSRINEKRLIAPGSIANSLLSEQKLRAVLENARQIIRIVDEFGSFHQYCWSFQNHQPVVSKFRYPRQVPVKSPKADMISRDMVRRGFRGVGPTVIYSFMQAAGLINDHLVSCFRFKECNAPPNLCTSDTDRLNTEADLKTDEPRTKYCSEETTANADLSRAIDTLIIS